MLDKSKIYTYDSRRVKSGDSFICLPKGDTYIKDALDKGAVEVIHMDRMEFALHAHDYYDHPTKDCCLIGVTGTNGKTSVTYFLSQLLEGLGHKVLVIGTINSSLTTPESWDLCQRIKHHVEQGGTHVILEVSSHGIDQYRVYGFDFNVKCLTNITQDHLDYHQTFDHYKATKMGFMEVYSGISIYPEDVSCIDAQYLPQFVGTFHLKNVSSALFVCQALGYTFDSLVPMLATLTAPEGRFEPICMGQAFSVVVDFAHTPDGLDHVLKEAYQQVSGDRQRLTVVFGCGGDRDAKKRPLMGAVAEKYSDNIILTADNSRSEDTVAIMERIKDGIQNRDCIQSVFTDRREAIQYAIKRIKPGDMLVVAGKGHEEFQYCQGYFYSYNDKLTLSAALVQQQLCSILPVWCLDPLQEGEHGDVLFLSNKSSEGATLKYATFDRMLPVPSHAKVTQYLKKLNGPKVIVIEQSSRISLGDILTWGLKSVQDCVVYRFDPKKSLDHNLSGLTLLQQTFSPIVILMSPDYFCKTKKITDILQPDHIVIGDIYNAQGFIEMPLIKLLQGIMDQETFATQLWFYQKMTDICDAIDGETSVSGVQCIQGASLMDYYQSLLDVLMQRLNVYPKQLSLGLSDYLMALPWYSKVVVAGVSAPIFVVDWQNDSVDFRQKMSFFSHYADNIMIYLLMEGSLDVLVQEIKMYYLSESKTIVMHEAQKDAGADQENVTYVASFKEHMVSHPKALYLVWKLPECRLSQLVVQLNGENSE
jgi:UDP-N-acetylmuramoyl-L-alanyl-D-glutamate--2,6-diaminopimelate ligase